MTRYGFAFAVASMTVLSGVPLLAARADEKKPASPDAKDASEKKEAKKPASPAPKVFTEEDLKKYSDGPAAKTGSKPAATAPAAAPAEAEEIPDSSQEHGGRQLWANRASDARDRIEDAQGAIAVLETRIAALRDDIGPGRAMEPFRLQAIEADIAKAMQELDAARKELAAARTAEEELQQEARRLGVPAGWLREP